MAHAGCRNGDPLWGPCWRGQQEGWGKALVAQKPMFTPLATSRPSFCPPLDMHNLALHGGNKVQKFPANVAPSPCYTMRG